MPNGVAALARLEHTPEDAPPANKPDAVSSGIELVGEAIASAATMLCFALLKQQNGKLTNETRAAGGERVAKLVELVLSGEVDLTSARTAGKQVLRQYLDADFFRRYSTEQGEEALDSILSELFKIVDRVVAFERGLAH